MRTLGKCWVVQFEDVLCIDTAEQGIAQINPITNLNADEDAAFIAKAWNCHDELVVALEAIKDAATTFDNPHLVLAFIENVAEKALALAKRRPHEKVKPCPC